MAIDRTFGSALNKALRGLEQAGVGPLAEDPGLGGRAGLPRGGTPRRGGRRRAGRRRRRRRLGRRTMPPDPLARRRRARRASRPGTPSGRPRRSSCAGSSPRRTPACGGSSPSSGAGVPRGDDPGGDRDQPVVPRRVRAGRRPRARRRRASATRLADPADAAGGQRCWRRPSGPGFGDRELAELAGVDRAALRATRDRARAAAGLRDGRHVRRRVRRRDALLLRDLRRRRVAARGRRRSPVRRPSSSARARSGSARGSSSTTARSRPPSRSAGSAGRR